MNADCLDERIFHGTKASNALAMAGALSQIRVLVIGAILTWVVAPV
jgi:hypothetical protein